MSAAKQVRECSVTVVVENTVEGRALLGEHGLAYWVDADGRRVLFDTGQGRALVHNLNRLSLHPSSLAAVALSHGHYDHTGGAAELLHSVGACPVVLHPAAREPKYKVPPEGGGRYIGIPESLSAWLRDHPNRVRVSREPVELLPGLWLTGEIPRQTEYEDVGGPFFLDPEGARPDPLVDDQALFIRTDRGIAIVLGCAHAGVINTLQRVEELCPGEPIIALIGGMHLHQASEARLAETIRALHRYPLEVLAPCHCTGFVPCAKLYAAFPAIFRKAAAGSRFDFPLPGQGPT